MITSERQKLAVLYNHSGVYKRTEIRAVINAIDGWKLLQKRKGSSYLFLPAVHKVA